MAEKEEPRSRASFRSLIIMKEFLPLLPLGRTMSTVARIVALPGQRRAESESGSESCLLREEEAGTAAACPDTVENMEKESKESAGA